jgi:hypothetical protein
MRNRIPHWSWLALFAACNLMFWIAAAIAVGILAGDKVNLGVESYVRARHGTVIAALQQITPRPARTAAVRSGVQPTSRPERSATPPSQPTRPPILAGQPTTEPLQPAQSPQPPTATPQVRATSLTKPTAKPTASPALLTPEPAVAAVREPLLLSDPDTASFAEIDAEMGRSAAGRPVQICFSEAALNREMAALLASSPDLPYHNLYVDLKRDHLVLTGDVAVLGFQVSAEVEGALVARDCLPQAEIDSISIAGLVTPEFVKDGIQDIIVDALGWYPADYPLCLEQIVVEEDRLTVYGSRR